MTYFNKISQFFGNEKFLVATILFIAYIIRVLPYLLGYDIPFADEGMRDFQQVKYLADFGQIHFFGSYFDYGAFPVLHLLVYAIYVLSGLDLLKIFLFVPQIFACLGLLFFYLFAKKYFSNQISLWALFLTAIFIPHIYWTAQPMRETMGLFFFPLIVYLFDQYFSAERPVSLVWARWLRLMTVFVLMVMSHYGSTLFIIGWVIMYTLFFIKDNKNALVAWLTIGGMVFLSVFYWSFFFQRGLVLLHEILDVNILVLLIILVAMLMIFFKFAVIIKWLNLDRIKSPIGVIGVIIGLVIFLRFAIYHVLPIIYPPQIWAQFVALGLLIIVGFFINRDKHANNLVLVCLYFPFLWVVALYHFYITHSLRDIPFDPFRTLEFIFLPLSILAAYGVAWLMAKTKNIRLPLVVFLIITSTFAYPSIFIFKTDFYGTPFYDIRSNIRYISDGARQLVKWANDHGYSVVSSIIEVNAYQSMFFPVHDQRLYIITKNDVKIKDGFSDYIKDPIVGISNVQLSDKEKYLDQSVVVYGNDTGYLAAPGHFDAEFVDADIPREAVIGELTTGTTTIKNTGNTIWFAGADLVLKDNFGTMLDKVKKNVLPGEKYEFKPSGIFDRLASKIYRSKWQMYQEQIGWFGGSLEVLINVKDK